jgi:hypothetical protein
MRCRLQQHRTRVTNPSGVGGDLPDSTHGFSTLDLPDRVHEADYSLAKPCANVDRSKDAPVKMPENSASDAVQTSGRLAAFFRIRDPTLPLVQTSIQ